MAELDAVADGVRVTRWPLIRFAAYAAAALATIVLGTIATRLLVPPEPSPWHALALLKNLVLPIALFVIYAGLVRVMERRAASEVDLRRAPLTFLAGILIGSAIIGLTIFVQWNLGLVAITEGTGLVGIERDLSVLMITTMGEELLFRVIFFKLLEEIVGSLLAILTSAAAFALVHLANPGVTPVATLDLAMLGVILALSCMLTRNVWIAVGIHAGWNFTQAFVFGVLNSGTRHPNSYFQTTFSGPDILTGGSFGLEGSIVNLGLCVVVSALLLVLVVRERRWRSLRFQIGSPQREFDVA